MGGTIHVSTDKITQSTFSGIVDNTKGKINILSGVHGTIDGTLLSDKSFYQADMAKWKNFSNIKIIDMNTINSNTLSKILNSSDTTICAWCYSERSIDVLKALNLLK